MTTPAALQRFVDDELIRAPMLADQMVEETMLALKRGGDTMGSRERQLVGDVLRTLHNHRPLIVREFVRALGAGVQAQLAHQTPAAAAPDSGLGALSLVDETQVEVDVEVSRALQAICSVAEHELREVTSYTAALVGDMEVTRDHNPLHPEVIAQALWAAAQALPLQQAYQLAFMRHASPGLAQLMRRTYAGACARLEAQGVEPATYRTVIIFGSQRGRRQQDSFFDPGANRTDSPVTLPPPGTRPTATRPALEQVLAHADATLRTLDAQADRPQREALRRAQRQQMVESTELAPDRELVELVGRLFDTVLGDRRLESDLQNLLARLQSAVLRLALRDPALLDHHTHPLWLFMDRIALQGELHPPPGDPERAQMLRFVHGLLDTLTSEQPRDSDPFRWARERLLAYERSRFEQRRAAVDAELHSLQTLEDQVVAGGPPPTSPGALDIGQLDTVPADLLEDLSLAGPGAGHPANGAQWLAGLRSSDWVHMFMQGRWVNAQLLWYGQHREYWLLADGASANTWAIRRGALLRMVEVQLLTTLTPRSLIREAAERVLQRIDA